MWSKPRCIFTREETRAELETLGTLSTIACFMYLSMACNMVVCIREKKSSYLSHHNAYTHWYLKDFMK